MKIKSICSCLESLLYWQTIPFGSICLVFDKNVQDVRKRVCDTHACVCVCVCVCARMRECGQELIYLFMALNVSDSEV